MFFDSHTHLNHEGYSEQDREKLFKDIEESEVDYVMDVAYDLVSSKMAVDHADRFPWCYAAVGCHPHDAKKMDEMELALIKALAKKKNAKAIGEIGLDFHYNNSGQDTQRYWFRRQIQLANELKMPIVIHSRDADQEVMDILKEEEAFSDERKSWFSKRPDGSQDARVLLHCFSGSAELAQQYIKLGATISVAGPVTYKNNKKTRKVLETIGTANLLIETDAPYLTPEPLRGKKNKSPFIEHTAKFIAEYLDMDLSKLAEITKENAMRFFNINP